MKKNLKITIMLDDKDSYLNDYISELIEKIKKKRYNPLFITDCKDIRKGDILFLLGCKTILSKEQLNLNTHNLVIHPSKLPEGRGSAALVNKILEGENKIYITLFKAEEKLDAGDFYFQESIVFEGHELSNEIRYKQTMKVFELVLKFLDNYLNVIPKKQIGKSSFYPKRTSKDSELDVDKTIREQFNLLRIVDNNRYPAFFYYKGHKYILHIFNEEKINKVNKNEKV